MWQAPQIADAEPCRDSGASARAPGLAVLIVCASIALGLCLLAGPARVSSAPPDGARLGVGSASLALPQVTVAAGVTVTLPVTLSLSSAEVYAAEITLDYDPAVMLARAVDKGALASGWSIASNLSPTGSIRVALAGASPITASGQLVLVTFAVTGSAGSHSLLDLTRGDLNEGALSCALVDGRLDVASSPPSFAPAALWINNYGSSPAGGGWTSYNTYPRLSGDVNGDGRADMVGFGAAGTFVSLSSGAAFGPASKWMSNFGASPAGGGWTSFDQYPRQVADVNGDGKADIVGFGGVGTYVALSTGAAFGPASKWISNFGYAAAGGGWTSFNAYPRLLGDVNGDGRADVVGFGAAGAYVALSTGAAFGTPALWINNFGAAPAGGGWISNNLYPRQVGDVNGDGNADIVGFGGAGTYVSLSTGSAFAPPTLWIKNFGYSAAGGGWTSQSVYPRLLGDVNGDGKEDIVGFGGNRVYVALSTGASFGSPVGTIANYCVNAGGWTTFDRYPRWVADVSGDARADIVGFGGPGTYVSVGQ